MMKNGSHAESEGGDVNSTPRASELQVRRCPQLQQEQANETAANLFMQRAEGPHSANVIGLTGRFTPRDIAIIQSALVEAIGEKDSEKRRSANILCADGLIDLEQGLGYFLFDGSNGKLPSPIEDRRVGKNTAKHTPAKKEKDKWKERAKAAREKAKKAGHSEEAIATAGKAARDEAEAAYFETEVSMSGIQMPPPTPPVPESSPEPAGPPAEPMDEAIDDADDLQADDAAVIQLAASCQPAGLHPSNCIHPQGSGPQCAKPTANCSG